LWIKIIEKIEEIYSAIVSAAKFLLRKLYEEKFLSLLMVLVPHGLYTIRNIGL
jgi:hypothetical protein